MSFPFHPIANQSLLSVSSDSKTVKGQKLGILTGILYLMPDNDLCPNAINAGCSESCLVTAGRAAIFTSVNQSRARRTDEYRNARVPFMRALQSSIEALIRKAEREGLKPAVRLNGTSDINWQAELIDGKTLFEHYPDVAFYDYSKYQFRSKHSNYHLTASYSGLQTYSKTVSKALSAGLNIAVVFNGAFPKTFLGLPVIAGDDSDVRFYDHKIDTRQCVIALKAKGEAKKDTSGFTVHSSNLIAAA